MRLLTENGSYSGWLSKENIMFTQIEVAPEALFIDITTMSINK